MVRLKPCPLSLPFLLAVFFLCTAKPHASAQEYPELFGTGPVNAGTEFYLIFPANLEVGSAADKYIRLYISSPVTSKVDIYALGRFTGSITTIPNEIVTFDLSNSQAQIIVRDEHSAVPDDGIYPGWAVHIVSEEPIIVYGMNRTSYTSDGFLALPVNALGKEYIVAAAAANVPNPGLELPSQFMITAPYDSTVVSIKTPMPTPNHGEGEEYTINLNKGDVYSSMSTGFKGDLSGAHIRASKPVAVTAGQNCTYLPDENYPACDHIVEMLTPVESWGKLYHALPYKGRTRGDTYRIFAGEPNAEIYINGNKLTTLSSVGGRGGFGWIEYREEPRRPLEFSSNKRIFVAQYNNSQQYDNSSGTDPFYAILMPVEQYQQELIFMTPSNDFPNNYLNLIGDSTAIAEAEITEAGKESWQKLTLLGGTPFTFPTKIDGKTYIGLSTSISPGAYQIRTPGLVAGYSYGGGAFDSYGYPLSAATAVISSDTAAADIAPPVVMWADDCPSTVAGMVVDKNDASGIAAGLSTVRLHPHSTNYRLTVDPFQVGERQEAGFRLTVEDPSREGLAVLIVADMAGNYRRDTLRYAPIAAPQITGSPDFGQVVRDASKEIQIALRNPGTDPMEIQSLSLLHGTKGFEVIEPTGPFSLDPDEERQVTLRFSSGQSEGIYRDSLFSALPCSLRYLATLQAEVTGTTGVGGERDRSEGLPGLTLLGNPTGEDRGEINYYLPAGGAATLELFAPDGAAVRTVVLPETAPGVHQVSLDLRGLSAGIYLCVLHTDAGTVSQRLVLLR